jgi:hypothetical protein
MLLALILAPLGLLAYSGFNHAPTIVPNLFVKTILFIAATVLCINFIYRKLHSFGSGIIFSFLLIIFCGLSGFLGKFLYFLVVVFLLLNETQFFIKYLSLKKAAQILVYWIFFTLLLAPYFSFPYYSQPINLVNLHQANLHLDTFYHLSIASMIKNYNSVSHGLHGLGELEYHFGSHALFAALSNLWEIPVIAAYSFFFPFLIIPLISFSVIGVAEAISPPRSFRIQLIRLLIFMFIFLGLGLLLKGGFFERFALWTSFYESESYAVSLILLMALFSIFISMRMSFYWQYVSAVLTCLMIVITKISTGFFGLAAFFFWIITRLSGNKWNIKLIIKVLSLISSLVISFLLFRAINPSMSDAHFEFLQFVNAYVEFKFPTAIKVVLFIFIHFIFPISALLLVKYCYPIKGLTPKWLIYSILFSMVTGIAVALLLYVQGGSGYYFSNVSMFISLPVILLMSNFFGNHIARRQYFILGFFLLVALINGYKVEINGFRSIAYQLNAKLIRSTGLDEYIASLEKIRDNPKTINSLVYIPRSEKLFWNGVDCRSAGFLIAGISERPALYAWPSFACYEFLCGKRFHSNGLCNKSESNFTDEQISSEASRLGFSQVLIIYGNEIRVLK